MSASHTERSLLLGMLALQLDFIDRDELIESMQAWMLDRERPLDEILLERQAVAPETRDVLVAVVQKHLELYDGRLEESLSALSVTDEAVRRELSELRIESLETPLKSDADISTDLTSPPPATVGTNASDSLGNRYRILRLQAKGGLGAVSIAFDEELHREVALKEIRSEFADDPSARSRFIHEAQVTGGLEHPGVVPVYGLGCDRAGRPFYAMRFIRGETLRAALNRFHGQTEAAPGERRLELRRLLGHFIDVCNAIEYAHSRGILHRDLKPSNVMLGKYGETLVVDWGLAKGIGRMTQAEHADEPTLKPGHVSPETRVGSAVGTPVYMSPEQAAGDLDRLDRTSDIYSLGATLYVLLTSEPPFSPRDDDVLSRVRTGDFSRPRAVRSTVPRPLEAICLKAMATVPADRYQSARDLAADIEHWLADEPVTAYRDRPLELAGRWFRRHRALAVTGAAALLLVATVTTAAAVLVANQNQRIREQNQEIARQNERNLRLAKAEAQARDQADAKRREAEKAQKMARSVIDEMAVSARALRIAPLVETAARFYSQWLEAFADTSDESSTIAQTRVDMALMLTGQGRYDEAEAAFEQGIRELQHVLDSHDDPYVTTQLALAYGNLGSMYLLAQRQELAIENLNLAVAMQEQANQDTSDPSGLKHLGRHLTNLSRALAPLRPREAVKRAESAGALLRKYVAQKPDDDEARYTLARSLMQLGEIRLGQVERLLSKPSFQNHFEAQEILVTAGDSLTESVDLLLSLHRAQPRNSEYTASLAGVLATRGRLFAMQRRFPAATDDFQTAGDLLEGLLLQFPDDSQYRDKLALIHYSHGLLLGMQNQLDESVQAYRSAIEIQDALIKESPTSTRLHIASARSWTNLGAVSFVAGDLDQAVDAVETAVARIEHVWTLDDLRGIDDLRPILRQAMSGLAQILLKSGDHARLFAAGERYANLKPGGSEELFSGASLMSLATRLVAKDSSLDEQKKKAAIDRYGKRAVELLRQAVAQGWQDRERLEKEPDLAPIRERSDFQELLKKLAP